MVLKISSNTIDFEIVCDRPLGHLCYSYTLQSAIYLVMQYTHENRYCRIIALKYVRILLVLYYDCSCRNIILRAYGIFILRAGTIMTVLSTVVNLNFLTSDPEEPYSMVVHFRRQMPLPI